MEGPGERLSRVRAAWSRGEAALGAVLTMPSIQMAQAIARMGFDWVVVDMEHYPMDARDVHETIAAMAGADVAPLVRVHWNEHWLAKPALDAGALGIVFPMIRNREEAEAAVAAVRYPPEGVRGWGPTYAQLRWNLGLEEYARLANEEILTVALMEHGDAVRNIHAIAETPGLDVAFIAPSDLAATLGHLGDASTPCGARGRRGDRAGRSGDRRRSRRSSLVAGGRDANDRTRLPLPEPGIGHQPAARRGVQSARLHTRGIDPRGQWSLPGLSWKGAANQ